MLGLEQHQYALLRIEIENEDRSVFLQYSSVHTGDIPPPNWGSHTLTPRTPCLDEDGNAVNGGQGQGGAEDGSSMSGGGGAGHGEYHKCAFWLCRMLHNGSFLF